MALTLTELAAGAGISGATTRLWRQAGLPGTPSGRTTLVEPAEVLAWIAGREWGSPAVARDRVVAFLRALPAEADPATRAGRPDLRRSGGGASVAAALRFSGDEQRDYDLLRPQDQAAALSTFLASLTAVLGQADLSSAQRAAVTREARALMAHGEQVRRGALATQIQMRRLLPIGEAREFAGELASAVVRELGPVPARVAELVAEGHDPEDAVTDALAEARVRIADAIDLEAGRLDGPAAASA